MIIVKKGLGFQVFRFSWGVHIKYAVVDYIVICMWYIGFKLIFRVGLVKFGDLLSHC